MKNSETVLPILLFNVGFEHIWQIPFGCPLKLCQFIDD